MAAPSVSPELVTEQRRAGLNKTRQSRVAESVYSPLPSALESLACLALGLRL